MSDIMNILTKAMEQKNDVNSKRVENTRTLIELKCKNNELLEILAKDYHIALDRLENKDNDTNRRLLTKETMVFIEGELNIIKHETLQLNEIYNRLDLMEVILLKEEKPHFDGNKIGKPQQNFMKTENKIIFVMQCNDKFYDIEETKIDKGCSDWANFLHIIKVRNALIHPKSISDLSVKDDDIDKCKKLYNWFYSIITERNEKIVKSLTSKMEIKFE